MTDEERKVSVYDAYLYNMSTTEIALYAREAKAELKRLRAIVARVEDVEGLRLLMKRTVEFWPDDAGKLAYAVRDYLKGEG